MTNPEEVLAFNLARAVEVAGIGRTTLYREIKAGRLRATKVGNRTVILRDDLQSWLLGCRDGSAAA